MKISVVILTYNRPALLAKCINSILKQSYKNYEIIIVNDCSTGNTKEVAEGFVRRNRKIRLFNNEVNRGEAASRNVGIKHARGDVITFIDDDCVADEDLLRNAVKAFKKDRNIVGVEGATLPARLPLKPFEHSLSNMNGGMFTTSNMSYKRGFIKSIMCDERLKLTNRVDTDLAFSVIERNGEIVFVSDAYVTHAVFNSSFISKLRKKTYFMNDVLLMKKHAMLYRTSVRFPFEKFTPFYILFTLLLFIWPYFLLALLATACLEISYRKYKCNFIDFVKFTVLQAIGSFVVIISVFYGFYKFRKVASK